MALLNEAMDTVMLKPLGTAQGLIAVPHFRYPCPFLRQAGHN